MVCQTVKKGEECFFMNGKGCGYNGGTCYAVVDQCQGCEKVHEYEAGVYCISYPHPELKWKNADCNFATHVKRELQKDNIVNALKASKRKAAGKI